MENKMGEEKQMQKMSVVNPQGTRSSQATIPSRRSSRAREASNPRPRPRAAASHDVAKGVLLL